LFVHFLNYGINCIWAQKTDSTLVERLQSIYCAIVHQSNVIRVVRLLIYNILWASLYKAL